jgi:hypothetical protein
LSCHDSKYSRNFNTNNAVGKVKNKGIVVVINFTHHFFLETKMSIAPIGYRIIVIKTKNNVHEMRLAMIIIIRPLRNFPSILVVVEVI